MLTEQYMHFCTKGVTSRVVACTLYLKQASKPPALRHSELIRIGINTSYQSQFSFDDDNDDDDDEQAIDVFVSILCLVN